MLPRYFTSAILDWFCNKKWGGKARYFDHDWGREYSTEDAWFEWVICHSNSIWREMMSPQMKKCFFFSIIYVPNVSTYTFFWQHCNKIPFSWRLWEDEKSLRQLCANVFLQSNGQLITADFTLKPLVFILGYSIADFYLCWCERKPWTAHGRFHFDAELRT